MPVKAAELWSLLGAPGRLEDQRFARIESLDAAGWKVQKGEPLFPRSEKKPAS
jgi:methionyl-tRNA synthetase